MARFYLDNIPKTPQADVGQEKLNIPNLPALRGPNVPNYPQIQPRDISSAQSLVEANARVADTYGRVAQTAIAGQLRVAGAWGRTAEEFSQFAGTLGQIATQIQKSGDTANRSRASNIVNRGILAFDEKATENRWNATQTVAEWELEEKNILNELNGIPLTGPEGEEMRSKLEIDLLHNRVRLKHGMREEQIANDKMAYEDRINLAVGRGDIEDALKANDDMLEGGSQNDTQHAHRKQEILKGGAEFYATRDLLANPKMVKQEMEEKLSPEGNKGVDLYPDMTDIATIRKYQHEASVEINRREVDSINEIENQIASGKIKTVEDIDKVAGGNVGADNLNKLKNKLLDPSPVYNQEAVTAAEVEIEKYQQEEIGKGLPEYHRILDQIRRTVSDKEAGILRARLYAKATEKNEGKLPGTDPFSQFIGNVWDDHNAGVFLPGDLKGKKLKDLDLNDPKQNAARNASTERGAMIIQALRQWAGDNPDKARDPVEVKKHLDELYKTDVSEIGKRAIQPPSKTRLQSQPEGRTSREDIIPPEDPLPKRWEDNPGMIEPGNIDLDKRMVVKNPDGSISTELSVTIEEDGKTVLIPTVVNGEIVDIDTAVAHYRKTGEHLGKFTDREPADIYAGKLHQRQEIKYGPKSSSLSPSLLRFVKGVEGFAPVAKWDNSQYSVGWGTRGSKGERITEAEANRRLVSELSMHARNVDSAAQQVGLELTENQRNALISYDFNTGAAEEFILKHQTIGAIAKALPRSRTTEKGKFSQGVYNRRQAEARLFMT